MRFVFVRQFALNDYDAMGVEDNDVWDTITGALIVFEIKRLIVEKVVAKGFQALGYSALITVSAARVNVLRFWNLYIVAAASEFEPRDDSKAFHSALAS